MHKRVTIQRFGEKMRTLRERQGLSIREVADGLGYPAAPNSYISEIETGNADAKGRFYAGSCRFVWRDDGPTDTSFG